jgi:hypothetical protein
LTRFFHGFEVIDLSLDSFGIAPSKFFIAASQRLRFAFLQSLLLILLPLRGGRVD